MIDHGYISIQFYKSDVDIFKNIIRNICGQNDFYYSDVIDYIQGDVTSNLHLTLFYGLLNKKDDVSKINNQIKKIGLKSVDLGKIFLMSGYKSLYQILCVEILDNNNKLKDFSEIFQQFNYEPSVQLPDFKPHLTLAYVKPNFQLGKIVKYFNSIKIKEIKYFEK